MYFERVPRSAKKYVESSVNLPLRSRSQCLVRASVPVPVPLCLKVYDEVCCFHGNSRRTRKAESRKKKKQSKKIRLEGSRGRLVRPFRCLCSLIQSCFCVFLCLTVDAHNEMLLLNALNSTYFFPWFSSALVQSLLVVVVEDGRWESALVFLLFVYWAMPACHCVGGPEHLFGGRGACYKDTTWMYFATGHKKRQMKKWEGVEQIMWPLLLLHVCFIGPVVVVVDSSLFFF